MSSASPYFYQNSPTQTQVISFTSGKGGVGKTTLTVHIAQEFARKGKKVLIFDGDLGLANADIMLNVRPQKTIHHVLRGENTLAEVVHPVETNLDLIAGGSGLFRASQLTSFDKQNLIDQVSDFGRRYDFMLVDTASGIEDHVLYLNSASHEICLVITPDPSSFTDSYALVKVLSQHFRETQFRVITNQVQNEEEGVRLFEKFQSVTTRFLPVCLNYWGSIPTDQVIRHAVIHQRNASKVQPHSQAVVSIRNIAQTVLGERSVNSHKGGLQFFWNQLLSLA